MSAGSSAAVKTLMDLGYTYRGGEVWEPPLGSPKHPDDVMVEIRATLHRNGAQNSTFTYHPDVAHSAQAILLLGVLACVSAAVLELARSRAVTV